MNDQALLTCVLQMLNHLILQTTTALLDERDLSRRETFATAATEHGHGQYAILEYLHG